MAEQLAFPRTFTGLAPQQVNIALEENFRYLRAWTNSFIVTGAAIPHGGLLGLGDDDHLQYSLTTGARPFTGTVGGIDPIAASDLTTKNYVDGLIGGVDLQGAYDADTSVPQIVAAAGFPLTVDLGSGTGDIFAVRDASAGDVFRQSAILQTISTPVSVDVDWNDFAGAQIIDWSPTIPSSGAAVVGMIRNGANITVNNSTFILGAFLDQSILEWTVSPGFAVSTLFLAQPQYKTTTPGIAPAQAVTLAAQPQFVNDGGGGTVPNVSAFTAVTASATLRTLSSGDVMNMVNYSGMVFQGIFGTVSGSSVNFGHMRGVWARNPVKGIFFPGSGIETIDSYAGLYQDNIGFNTGNPIRAAVRSFMQSGTNKWFLLNSSTAHSDHGAGHIYFNDNRGVAFGGLGTAFDVWLRWSSTYSALAIGFFSTFDDLIISHPSTDTFLISSNDTSDNEIRFDFERFAFGQSGFVGNNVGVFVANGRSTGVAGEWADYLLTQAGNLTVDHAMGAVLGWSINAPSIVLGTGTVLDAGALRVAGNVTQGSVNRFGLQILSNPSGGSGVNAALWVTAGLSRFDGRVDINNGIALGGGAAATLGTIGGSGPTAVAQAQWLEVDIGGTAHWIPVWT